MGSLSLQRLCILGALELVLLLSLMHSSFAQNNNCSADTLSPLLPCLPYIEAGNTSTPASDCCTPLQSLFASADPTCLCQLAPLAQQTGITINETRALEVASSCNQTVPASVQACLSSQTIAPAGAPSTSPTSPSNPTSPSTFSPPPQTGSDNSSGSDLSPPYSLLLVGSIFVALFLHLGGTGTST